MDANRIREGMEVRAVDGEKVGTVIGVGQAHFQVERGLLPQHDFLVDYRHVASVLGHHVTLSLRGDQLVELEEDVGGATAPRRGDLSGEHTWSEDG